MPLIVLRHDQSLVHVNAESQRPIVPVLAGETVTILRDGAVLDTVGVAGCGPFRVDEPFYGGCRLFGLEPEVLEAVRTRLDPRVGNGDARVWQVVQQLCNSETAFDGTAESLREDPPINLARFGADSGSWLREAS